MPIPLHCCKSFGVRHRRQRELTKVKPRIGKSGLDERVVELKASNAIAYQPQTINVTKSMADDDGMVYLIGYGNETTNTHKLTAASTTFKSDADFAVMVQFVDGPARAFDADQERQNAYLYRRRRRCGRLNANGAELRQAHGHGGR